MCNTSCYPITEIYSYQHWTPERATFSTSRKQVIRTGDSAKKDSDWSECYSTDPDWSEIGENTVDWRAESRNRKAASTNNSFHTKKYKYNC
jgi:hypothetical protein